MRYTARDDLAILSADIYPPGLTGLSYSGSTRSSKKGLPVRTSDATQDGPRKRAKAQPPAPQKKDDHHGEEEEKKRTRGRPRLDVKDETAADASYPLPPSATSQPLTLSSGGGPKSAWPSAPTATERKMPSRRSSKRSRTSRTPTKR